MPEDADAEFKLLTVTGFCIYWQPGDTKADQKDSPVYLLPATHLLGRLRRQLSHQLNTRANRAETNEDAAASFDSLKLLEQADTVKSHSSSIYDQSDTTTSPTFLARSSSSLERLIRPTLHSAHIEIDLSLNQVSLCLEHAACQSAILLLNRMIQQRQILDRNSRRPVIRPHKDRPNK
ncbi:unnamed protein product [Protopolystoma xenopodis]|uniref:Uncharacterized protein n=1 Tax=Protopolystoma xenopodis TaxID=117903 RepID=A0A3S4ZN92_9PLAT|nr:unnamed protein product [Protopolystoma xenopodis]